MKDKFNKQDIDYLKDKLKVKNFCSYSELGTLISERAKEHFDKWYDNDTKVYHDSIKEEYFCEYTKDKYLYYVYYEHIELTEKEYLPLMLGCYYITKHDKETKEEKDSIYLY